MIALAYLYTLVVGATARAWRVLRNRECPCDLCQDHRAFTGGHP